MDSMDTSGDDLNSTQAIGRKKRYKNLITKNRDLDKKLFEPEITTEDMLRAMQGIIRQSDDVITEGDVTDRTEHTTEVVLDAQLLKMNVGLLSKFLQQSPLTNCFSDRIYQNAINQLITRAETEDWHKIEKIACKVAHMARTKSTMLGAVTVEAKPRIVKERQVRKKFVQGEEKRPETVNKLQRHDKGAEKVNIVYKQLTQIFKNNNSQPMPFYKLVIDPNNFMNTIENAFQMAFLVNDNRIAIETGEDSYPHVRIVRKDESDLKTRVAVQSLCALNVTLCQEMILFYDIKEPMLLVVSDEEPL